MDKPTTVVPTSLVGVNAECWGGTWWIAAACGCASECGAEAPTDAQVAEFASDLDVGPDGVCDDCAGFARR